ncbi:MAG: DUF692 family protein [Candidatus Omnitrophica bacterium]|nr:DUF692 family protein [Candidatus Omnitrophota bacterium]MDD5430399.1 DUF692 family protein [Candidatus Omnitrophota bacterium]
MIYISSSAASARRINEAVKELIGLGIKNIEFSGNVLLHKGWAKEILSLKKTHGLSFLMHNYFPAPIEEVFVLNLASGRADIREKTFALISRAAKLMDILEVPLYSIHSGQHIDVLAQANDKFRLDESSVYDKTEALKVFYENLEYLMSEVFKKEQKFAVENFFPFRFDKAKDYSLMSKPQEILDFITFSRKYENLGFLLDLGHLDIAARAFGFDAENFTRELVSGFRDKIFEIHLSGNNGLYDSHKVNLPESWQIKWLEENYRHLKDIPVVFEWKSGINSRQVLIEGLDMAKVKFKESCHKPKAVSSL